MKTLLYTGPCQSCSLGKSKKTGAHIMVAAGQEFRVHEEDADWLQAKYGKLVTESEPEPVKAPVRRPIKTDDKPVEES